MSIDQLALLGIGVFGFIAIVQAYSTLRTLKRNRQRAVISRTEGRYRRPVGAESVARSIAEGLVTEVAQKHKFSVDQAKQTGEIPEDLDTSLKKAQSYYRDRVESRLRSLFHEAVNKIILGKTQKKTTSKED